VGVAFDIDGVLIRGGDRLPGAAAALGRLRDAGVACIYMTNGGGVLEEAKAEEIQEGFGLEVVTEQMLLAHTPMRGLAEVYGDSKVLILGHKDYVNVARNYGFRRAVTVEQVFSEHPTIVPFRKPLGEPPAFPGEPIEAVLVFYDPLDWMVEAQVVCDVMAGNVPSGGPGGEPPRLYASNPDLIFSSAFPAPRLAQGAFVECVQHLFRLQYHADLEVTHFGKPTPEQYRFAERMLSAEASRRGLPPPRRFFMVGDNPRADMRGAINAGASWEGVLVRTGVFQGGDNDERDPGDHVVDDVSAAVDLILRLSQSS